MLSILFTITGATSTFCQKLSKKCFFTVPVVRVICLLLNIPLLLVMSALLVLMDKCCPIIVAVATGYKKVMLALLSAGVDIRMNDGEDWTAFHWASHRTRVDREVYNVHVYMCSYRCKRSGHESIDALISRQHAV